MNWCYECGADLIGSELNLESLDKCNKCKIISKLLFVFLFIATTLILLFYFYSAKVFNFKNFLNLIGLISGVWGGYFLATGYTSIMIRFAGGWGGIDQESVKKYGSKTIYRINFGLFLLIVSFVSNGVDFFY